LEIGFWHILFVLSAASVFQAVPANVAGIGPAEVAGTGLYLALGVSWPAAVLLVSLLFSYRLLVAVIGGTWELLALRRASRSIVEDPSPR